jgi:DNA polymerase-1
VFGFVRDLLFLIEEKRPDRLVCAFDPPGDTFRHELFAAYKGDRAEMPGELASQLPKIREVLDALAVPVVSVPGFEADDVLATLARECDEAGHRCYVVTGDKDCRQLITDRVSIFNIRKNAIYDAVSLADEWGIRPDQVVDFQSLVGDKVDNVPGVPLIGPKIAAELLNTYGNLHAVLDSAAQVKGAKRSQNLVEHRDQALLSQQLVRLDNRVPVIFDWSTAGVGDYQGERLAELFNQFGFRSLTDRVLKLAEHKQAVAEWTANYQAIASLDELRDLVAKIPRDRPLSVDTETTSTNPRAAKLVGVSLAWVPGEAYYVPVAGPPGEAVLDLAATVELLRPVLESPDVPKVGQNLKYDMIVLQGVGIELQGIEFDTMIASYLLDAGERSHSLDELAIKYLAHENTKIATLIGKGKQQRSMADVPVADVAAYAGEDADVALRLVEPLAERLASEQLDTLNREVEVPLIGVLARLEYEGIRIDSQLLSDLSRRFSARLAELEVEIEDLAGHPFNIASPKQLAQVLFDELNLRVVKRTKTGPSTDASVLEELASEHPLPAKIIEHRQYAKLKSTYVDALPLMVNAESGRVHTSLNQVVAATGRLSSNEPNLQNIPVRTTAGREIRAAFVARDSDWRLLAADYSQIELRVLAHFSHDETLASAFANDLDIHTLVASQVNHVPLDQVTSDMRRAAKAVNFGIIYGQSPFGLAKSLGISKDEAARFIAEYFARYPGVADFMNDTLAVCRRQGFVTTLLGRRRAIAGVRGPLPVKGLLFDKQPQVQQLNMPERTAVNTIIQGTAADLIKLAMLAVDRRLRQSGLQAKMVLQIHDELLFDAPAAEIDELASLVRDEMESVATLRVPLKVDVKAGRNWADCDAIVVEG